MNEPFNFEAGLEPERYELDAPGLYQFNLDRRDFFKSIGCGILVLSFIESALAQTAGRRGGGRTVPQEIGAWIHINEQGGITVFTGKVEVGQNIRTSLAQVVAEELSVPLNSIALVMGDTDRTPYDAGTFGSRTTPAMAQQLRRAAAAAREILIDLAAEQLEKERSSLTVAGGEILHEASGASRSFGALTEGKKLTRTVADPLPTTPPDNWKITGKSVPKVNGRDFVTGRHHYTSDLKLPGMVYGKVLRPPAWGASLLSVELSAAEKLPGVKVVRDGNFVGVTAPSEYQAELALEAVEAKWEFSPQISDSELFDHFIAERNRREPSNPTHRAGSMEEGWKSADIRLEQTYTVDYIAHAPLEPRAAVAQWNDGKLTVWTGTQRPFGVRGELANAFRLSEENIRVIVPDTGSGYGGKHSGEAAVEAARLAQAAGKPVKLVWTREEEFAWAYFRPAGVIQVSSGITKDGRLAAWEFHNINSGASAIRTLYDAPNQLIAFHPVRSPLRQGSYRALASAANVFARETHMDELAHAAGIDPLEFRLKNLRDERLRAVFLAASEKFGWGGEPPSGHGYGIGGGFEKGSYVATCAEVRADANGSFKVLRAVTAFECGAIHHPDHLRSQVEGCVLMGLGGALFESIRFQDGKILNPSFSRYRVPRFRDMPKLETVLLDRKDLPPAGAGETPIVGIAPAIGNALYQATGKRARSLPLAI